MPHLPEFFDAATHEGNLSRYAVPSLVVVHARSEADAVEAAQQALDDANVEGEAVGWSDDESESRQPDYAVFYEWCVENAPSVVEMCPYKFPLPESDYSPAYQDEYQRLWHATAEAYKALEAACRQLVGAEFGSNAWAESWDNLEAVLGMRESDG